MKTALIGYATHAGTSRDIAEIVAQTLAASGYEVRVAELGQRPAIDQASLVVVGSGIEAGQWYPEATSWIAEHAEQLRACRVAVFNACLKATEPDKLDVALSYNNAVVERTGAVANQSFPGRFVPEKINWWRRIFLKVMQQPAQDHLDREAVRRWASGLQGLAEHV